MTYTIKIDEVPQLLNELLVKYKSREYKQTIILDSFSRICCELATESMSPIEVGL